MNYNIVNFSYENTGDYKMLSDVLEPTGDNEARSFLVFWKNWLNDKIKGDKITIIAKDNENIYGVVRFWKSPFCCNKWLIEGLYVLKGFRKLGVGGKIILFGLKQIQGEKIYVHINDNNEASKELFKKIGFTVVKRGRHINSFGKEIINSSEYVFEVSK